MDDIEQLEYLSLVSKVCTELDNHLGLNDKDLAEFIIKIADKHPRLDKFSKSLSKKGAQFPESFTKNLLSLIQRMRPPKQKQTLSKEEVKTAKDHNPKREKLKTMFPALCKPDNVAFAQTLLGPQNGDEKITEEDDQDALDTMDQLEALMSSNISSSSKTDSKRETGSHESDKSKRKDRSSHSSSSKRRSNMPHRLEQSPPDDNKRHRNRSRSPHKSRRRSRSKSPKRSRSNRGRDRSRSPESSSYRRNRSPHRSKRHSDSSNRSGHRDHSRSSKPNLPSEPKPGDIYNGSVTSLMQFGCFVQMEGLSKRYEGLVHISELRQEGRVAQVSDVVQRSQKVKVKVRNVYNRYCHVVISYLWHNNGSVNLYNVFEGETKKMFIFSNLNF